MTVAHHKPQMYGPSRAGHARGVCSIHAPAAWQDPESLLTRVGSSHHARFSLALTLPRNTGRGFGLGILSAEGRGCRPSLAKVSHSQASGVFQNLTDLPEFHSSKSSVRRRLDSHDANENGLTHAQTSFAPGAKAHD